MDYNECIFPKFLLIRNYQRIWIRLRTPCNGRQSVQMQVNFVIGLLHNTSLTIGNYHISQSSALYQLCYKMGLRIFHLNANYVRRVEIRKLRLNGSIFFQLDKVPLLFQRLFLFHKNDSFWQRKKIGAISCFILHKIFLPLPVK